MLKVTLIGNLGHDPERRVTEDGKVVTNFSVGVSVGRDRSTMWVDVTTWEALAESCAQYLRKGSKVAVVGRPSARGWIGQDGRARSALSVTAAEVEFLTSRREAEAQPDEPVDPETGYAVVNPEDKPW